MKISIKGLFYAEKEIQNRVYNRHLWLFHVGHLNILEKAKENCEYLVVGVSTDELVKEYKGEFPIIPFEDRLRIVKSLKCVDQVIPQKTNEQTGGINGN